MVLIFSDSSKTQIYKMRYRDNRHHEIQIPTSFKYLNLFKPYDKIFLFKFEGKKYIYVGEKTVTFETKDTIVIYSSDLGLNHIIYPFGYREENVYFTLHRKYFPIQKYENSTEQTNITIYIKKIMKRR